MKALMKTLMCAFVLVTVMSAAASANLVENGDFEAGWFEYWHSGAADGGYVGIADDDNGPSAPGEYCAYLSTEGVGGNADIRSYDFELDPEWTELIYSFDYKVDKTAGDDAHYQLRFFEGPDNHEFKGEMTIRFGDTAGDWAVDSGTFEIPEGAGYADVRISVGVFDNFEGVAKIDNVVVSVFDPAARNPVPEDGAEGVGYVEEGLVYVDLSWDAGMDPENPPDYNPNITTYYLYLDDGTGWTLEAEIPAEGATATHTVEVDYDTSYLWRVDQKLEDDPEDIEGHEWSFETLSSLSIIEQPENVLADTGDDAYFTVEGECAFESALSYQWYRSYDSEIDPGGDSQLYSGTTLELLDVGLDDEAYYYCMVSSAEAVAYSDVVTLGIRRYMPVGHWTLDAADYQQGQYIDLSGEGNHAEVGGEPTFVDGIVTGDQDPENMKTSGAVQIQEDDGWADVGSWNPAEFTNQFTISIWLKWTQHSPEEIEWNTIVSKRDGWTGIDDNMFQILISGPTQQITMQSWGDPSFVTTEETSVEPDEWYHLAAVYDGEGAKLYLDGELAAQVDEYVVDGGGDSRFWIGRIGDHTGERFDGVLDDLQVFNYALAPEDIADLYQLETGETVCLVEYIEWDLTGDCAVHEGDLSLLVSEWLESGMYPVED